MSVTMKGLVVLVCLVGVVHGAAIPCSHDGNRYSSGQNVTVSCTQCACEEGFIKCPKELGCPKSCHYKLDVHPHGSSWLALCNTCVCHDGTIICNQRQCEDSCEIGGQQLLKGETFKRDCNTCTCEGSDRITCTKKVCSCTNHEGTEVANGEFWKDANCNQCVCKDGNVICGQGGSCSTKRCSVDHKFLRDGERTKIECLEFQCVDGTLVLINNRCF